MANQNNCSSDSLPPDDELSSQEDIYSPLSNYSTYSHEIKYIFEPIPDDDADYSQISPRTKIPTYQPPSRTLSTASCPSHSGVGKENAPPAPPASHSTAPYPYCPLTFNQFRRKTWSPPALKMSLAVTDGQQSRRMCHSNDTLDWDMQPIIPISEEGDRAPPRLAPVSGVLPMETGRSIIRPKAFKPISNHVHPINSPRHVTRRFSNQEELRSHENHGRMNISSCSINPDGVERQRSFSSDFSRASDRPESLPAFSMSRISNNMEVFLQTPSPSDSGVGELEAMLKEKDAELNTLRDVMDKNERAIFQVYEEKKQTWLKELQELKEDYERKLKIHQRKSYKTDQVLSMQVYKLQQEKKQLKDEYDKVCCEKEILRKQSVTSENEAHDLRLKLENCRCGCSPRNSQIQEGSEMAQLQRQIKEQRDEIACKDEEIAALQQELQTTESEIESKNQELSVKFREILGKTEELKALKNRLGHLTVEEPSYCDSGVQTDVFRDFSSPASLDSSMFMDKSVSSMFDEMSQIRGQLNAKNEEFEREREQWLDEKNKVVRYQKQLQLNYLQMYRKNRMLEAEVEQLTLELENRDLKLMAMNGEESVC